MRLPPTSLLTICGLEELSHHSARGVTHVLSILDPDWAEPTDSERMPPTIVLRFAFMMRSNPGRTRCFPNTTMLRRSSASGAF